ncbi:MAG TPA: enoyl-CoA hydratase/isomerase family protein [Anaeromyxobacteraceae bacterium]|nr:enoyl-CoA hydratase/isomerase family protein [Anaeromyxobacteraceae bacterium]
MTAAPDLEPYLAAGMARADAERLAADAPVPSGDLARDWAPLERWLGARGEALRRLPARPARTAAEQAAASALLDGGRRAREAFLRRHAAAVYRRLTGDLGLALRLQDLAGAAAAAFPGLVPSPGEVARERDLLLVHQDGLQIDQGILFAHLFADRRTGLHLLHAMSRPTPAALDRLGAFRASGRAELPSMTLERRGELGRITFHHQDWLNAEDDEYREALETLVDLCLLDDGIRVGVLRGAPMEKPKYAGRRVFGSGINLTLLYRGRISLVGFMLEREIGPLAKIHRGLARPDFEPDGVEDRAEKPFIGAVDEFAIGGHCQMLLVLDRVIAQRGSYFNLPARKEGIIPGVANLRLPRFVGERAARQGIFFDRRFPADSPEGRLICDEVVDGEAAMEAAIAAAAAELQSAGITSLVGNRRALRVGSEPLDLLREYMAVYSREQAYCLYSPALVENLVRNWNAAERLR